MSLFNNVNRIAVLTPAILHWKLIMEPKVPKHFGSRYIVLYSELSDQYNKAVFLVLHEGQTSII